MQNTSTNTPVKKQVTRHRLATELTSHLQKCIECQLCRRECRFLQQYGSPKHIAATYDPASPACRSLPFACSLCGLCASVCPVKLDPSAMFLEMRREAVIRDTRTISGHNVILNYEKRGASRIFSYYGLPENCDTILFPGCALPGTRPAMVKALFHHLQKTIPALGLVLDCCTKPSHDLGREKHFLAMFGKRKEYLLRQGVRNVLVACPNCYKIFKQYGDGLRVRTVYEYLAEGFLPETAAVRESVTIHDPCGTRNEEQIQKAVRMLAAMKSLTTLEMQHHGQKTICCGEGGSAGCVHRDFSTSWSLQRKNEAGELKILTYCAGCANYLGAVHPTLHLLDLLFEPEATLAGKARVSRSPWTYLNRLLLKRYFKKKINPAARRFSPHYSSVSLPSIFILHNPPDECFGQNNAHIAQQNNVQCVRRQG